MIALNGQAYLLRDTRSPRRRKKEPEVSFARQCHIWPTDRLALPVSVGAQTLRTAPSSYPDTLIILALCLGAVLQATVSATFQSLADCKYLLIDRL